MLDLNDLIELLQNKKEYNLDGLFEKLSKGYLLFNNAMDLINKLDLNMDILKILNNKLIQTLGIVITNEIEGFLNQ